MTIYDHPIYQEDVRRIAALSLPWEKLRDKTLLLSGGTGMIGSFFVDVLLKKNEEGLNCHILALGRSRDRAMQRFGYAFELPCFSFVEGDINQPLSLKLCNANDDFTIDYVLHLASNTHPVAYATQPIQTILTNVLGTQHMMEMAVKHHAARVLFTSSNEIYGENRGDQELFDESYCGYIDSNTLRAGYPESKRCGEALCQAYIRQKGLDVVIARLTRSFGPTLLSSDTKALSQFLRNSLHGENIVLKSAGNQYYSYTYAPDAVAGLLTVLFKGKCGEAYNVADESLDITLKDLAGEIASLSGTRVVFDLPDAVEAAGFSKATKARLDGAKIRSLGWKPQYSLTEGLERTLSILKELQ